MSEATRAAPDQARYARLLAAGTTAGLALLVVLFGLYMSGLVAPQVPHEALPALWTLPADRFLAETGIPAGWGWIALAGRGDVLTLAGIAILAFCSVPCLAAVMPLYWAAGQRLLFSICAVEILVIAFAASGWIGGGH